MKIYTSRSSLIVLSLLILTSFLALSPASAAKEGDRCLSLKRDLTNPSIAGFLGQRTLLPLSPERNMILRSGQKVSRQTFAVGGLDKLMAVEITCTSTCTGNGCSINGCDASSFGCSSCSCWGIGCSACTCSKKSVFTE